jgi:non-ribosomal peptide synthetase component E (peptide arylation enzyme)
MNTADYLLERSDSRRVALIAGKTQYTYQDLRDASARVAARLAGQGVRAGARVASWATIRCSGWPVTWRP